MFGDLSGQETPTNAVPELVGSTTGWRQYVEIQRDGVRIIVYKTGSAKGKVVRVISTDPRDYLNPSYSPGSDIML